MSHPDSEADPLVPLAEEFAARYRRGDRPSLTEYVNRYPEQADRIRRLFPAMVVIEELGSVEGPETGPSGRPATDRGHTLRELGDYRILHEVGRGGMGVVYEAEQVSLGRRVALKVLPRSATGDAKSLERFRREARSAARLHHTNIVPVFEVGQEADAFYYAMQLIRGQGLDQVIEELRRQRGRIRRGDSDRLAAAPPAEATDALLARVTRSLVAGRFEFAPVEGAAGDPSAASPPPATGDASPAAILPGSESFTVGRPDDAVDPRSNSAVLPGGAPLSEAEGGRHRYHRGVAQIGEQVARALGHAHARGIVHRDIKPSNILLDVAGTAWVVDFGLAKSQEDGLTNPGDFLGTLRFMAPERLRGEGDCRSDVYALGLTLYELLSLRPAFEATDRLELIERVKNQEPPRPRVLDPKIPRDLETIVLKAIAKDPHRRYQSADAMADDLRRFLDGEPIRARKVSALGRAALWARRRPTEAALATVGVVAAVAMMGMAVSLWYGDRLRAALYLQRIATAGLAWRDGNFGRLEQLLDSCPDGYHGLWEWRYLKRQCHPEQLLLTGHRGGIYRLAYSPDGARIATVSLDGDVKLWDAGTGRLIDTFSGHTGDAYGVAFSPDGRHLVSTSADGTINLWAWKTRRRTQISGPGPGARIAWDVAFSPDGDRFATAEAGGVVRIWDVKTGHGEELPGASRRAGDVYRVAFSPDGRLLAFGGAAQPITLWDLAAREVDRTLGGPGTHNDAALGLAFRPGDGRLLATSGTNGVVKLWDIASGHSRDLRGHTGDVYGVAFSPDGTRLATASGDPSVKLWDTASGDELLTLTGHAATVFDVAFSRDGAHLATGSQDRTVRIWDPSTDPTARVLRGHDGPVNAVAFHPSGRFLASAGEDKTVRLWDATNGQSHVLTGHEAPVTSLAFDSGSGLLATADRNGTVRLWDTPSGRPRGQPLAHLGSEVPSLAFHLDGRLLSVASDGGVVRTWDVSTRVERIPYAGHRGSVRGVAISPGGRLLATGGEDRTVILRDAATGQAVHPPLEGHFCWVYSVAFAPDGRALSSAGGLEPGAPLTSRLASVSGDGEIRLWDVTTGREVLAIRSHGNLVRGVAFHPDGSRLASASLDRTIKLWDATTGGEVLTLRGHAGGVQGVAFSPDGHLLASAGADGTVRVWDGRR